jgi:chromosome segregation ATPase
MVRAPLPDTKSKEPALSPLTKLFVSLMIVCSLLLTGGVVVFVNAVQDYKLDSQTKDNLIKQREAERDSANFLAQTSQDNLVKTTRELNIQINDLKAAGDKADQAKATADAASNALKVANATLTADNSSLTNTLAALIANLGDIQKRYDAILAECDKLQSRNTELATSNTDYQKRLEELRKNHDFLSEQLIQAKADLDRYERLLAGSGVKPEQITLKPVPGLNGVVRSIKTQDNVVFATISLGSADRVDKGMRFIVINPNTNSFLANFTIQAVDPTESFGRLDGPAVGDVRPGSVVMPPP